MKNQELKVVKQIRILELDDSLRSLPANEFGSSGGVVLSDQKRRGQEYHERRRLALELVLADNDGEVLSKIEKMSDQELVLLWVLSVLTSSSRGFSLRSLSSANHEELIERISSSSKNLIDLDMIDLIRNDFAEVEDEIEKISSLKKKRGSV